MADEKLFEEFPPVPVGLWEETIRTDLKGADYDKKLIWKTSEGFNVKPYYRAEDLNNLQHLQAEPGQFPYVRGTKSSGNAWKIRQDIWVDHPSDANKKALHLLSTGVTAPRFCFSQDACAKYLNEASFEILFRNIPIDKVELNFSVENHAKDVLSVLKPIALKRGIEPGKLYGTINFDFLGNLTIRGQYYNSKSQDLAALMAVLQKERKNFPLFRALEVNGSIFRNAGSTIVQELGFSLALANDYITLLSEKGVTMNDIFRSIHFTFGTGQVYFMEIAKLRAARLLWSKIAQSWSLDDNEAAKMYIHSVTSNWDKTIYDPYVNLLRTTTEAMAAVIGGTDSLTVKPFDSAYTTPSEFSERIARNIQILLKEEAWFDKVADPAAGSYYIESLVASIAQEAWEIFSKTAKAGGYLAALAKGLIQEQVHASASTRFANIASRREILLGVNQYPNATEHLSKQVNEAIAFTPTHGSEGEVTPLNLTRGSVEFEKMRMKTEKRKPLPTVFMLTTGNLSMRIARANFSYNFFAAAGFEVIDNLGFTGVKEGIEAAVKSKADIIVLCSSDEEYAALAPEAFDLLRDVKLPNGKTPVLVVAGAPECMEELKVKGISHFIHVHTNVLETLKQFQQILGL